MKRQLAKKKTFSFAVYYVVFAFWDCDQWICDCYLQVNVDSRAEMEANARGGTNASAAKATMAICAPKVRLSRLGRRTVDIFDQKYMFHRSIALCSLLALNKHWKMNPSLLDCTLKFPLWLQACWRAQDTFLRLNTASLCMAECVCVYVCAAVCEPSCGAHGTCVEPNRCQCRDGWNGRHCNKSKTTSLFPRPRY